MQIVLVVASVLLAVVAGTTALIQIINWIWQKGHKAGHTQGHQAGYSEGHQTGYTEGYQAGYAEGYQAGYAEGHEAGHAEGYQAGHAEGHKAGHAEGYEAGYTEGYKAQVAIDMQTLMRRLGRTKDGSSVEVADLGGRLFGVRDTKDVGSGHVFIFTDAAWRSFLDNGKNDG